MIFSKRRIGESREWLSIDDMFFDAEKERVVRVKAFEFENSRGQGWLPLLRVDFLDDRSTTDVINGFGMTLPEATAKALIEAFPNRAEDDIFYNLVKEAIKH